MCTKILLVFCLFAIAHAVNGVAEFITKCKWDDTTCLKNSAQTALPYFANGIPALGIEKLDPLYYEELDASSKDLKFKLSDIDVKGIKECVVKKIQRNHNPFTRLVIKVMCTAVTVDGQYDISGRLLFLPIEGNGKLHAVLRQLHINMEADTYEKTGENGKKYWHLKSYTHTYELKDKSEIELENLFEGNNVLGLAVNSLMKSSANEVIDEVGTPIIKSLIAKVVKQMTRFFKAVPAEELTIE